MHGDGAGGGSLSPRPGRVRVSGRLAGTALEVEEIAPKVRAAIIQLVRKGNTFRASCAATGLPISTFHYWMKLGRRHWKRRIRPRRTCP